MPAKLRMSRIGVVLFGVFSLCGLLALVLVSGASVSLQSIVLVLGLSWLAVIDLERMILPDVLTLGLLAAGLGFAGLAGFDSVIARIIGSVCGYVLLAVLAWVFVRWRGVRGLGGGDAKLLAAGGAWLGWSHLPVAVLAASVMALASAPFMLRRVDEIGGRKALPFGPFLAAGIWLGWCLIHRN